ncbi:hypothetical protein QL285_045188 [Trifolium repens]|nr:hypothetical protein QL285_045188 [Trifolium repens]
MTRHGVVQAILKELEKNFYQKARRPAWAFDLQPRIRDNTRVVLSKGRKKKTMADCVPAQWRRVCCAMAQRPERPALWRKAGCAMAQLASLNFDRSPKF